MKKKIVRRKKGLPAQLKMWQEHLAKVRKENPHLSLKEAMKKAKKTYSYSNDKKQKKYKWKIDYAVNGILNLKGDLFYDYYAGEDYESRKKSARKVLKDKFGFLAKSFRNPGRGSMWYIKT